MCVFSLFPLPFPSLSLSLSLTLLLRLSTLTRLLAYIGTYSVRCLPFVYSRMCVDAFLLPMPWPFFPLLLLSSILSQWCSVWICKQPMMTISHPALLGNWQSRTSTTMYNFQWAPLCVYRTRSFIHRFTTSLQLQTIQYSLYSPPLSRLINTPAKRVKSKLSHL